MGWSVTRAISSCLGQVYPPTEFVVIDSGSDHDTHDVVRTIAENDSRIRYVRLPQNAGHLAALRAGIRSTKAVWIALLDTDDELTVDSLSARLRAAAGYYTDSGERPQLI